MGCGNYLTAGQQLVVAIPIKCPAGGKIACKEYHNFKNFYSIVLMGMVDSHYRYIWGSCGYPDNSHDAIIFKWTELWSNIKEGSCIPQIIKDIGGVNPLIVGDAAFAFEKWIMKPYTNAVLSEKQKYFNYRLSRARMVTEGPYGQLKGRWRILLWKRETGTSKKVRRCTLACVILHNVCIDKGDTMSRKLDLSIDPGTNQRTIKKTTENEGCTGTRDNSLAAGKIWDCLSEKLWLEKQTGRVNWHGMVCHLLTYIVMDILLVIQFDFNLTSFNLFTQCQLPSIALNF